LIYGMGSAAPALLQHLDRYFFNARGRNGGDGRGQAPTDWRTVPSESAICSIHLHA
jgi:hypothetical protein